MHDVWGPPSLRARMRRVAKDGATGGAVGGATSSWTDWVLAPFEVDALALVIVVFAFVFVLISWLVRRIAAFIRRRRHQLVPNGALAPPAAVSPRRGRAGRVVATMVASPLSGRRCAGFSARLTHGNGRAVMLHDAATVGFDVVLDDGARVRIPAGPLVLAAADDDDAVALSAAHVDGYLRAIDPRRAGADDLDPFPYHRVEETVIRSGDRIEVLGALHAVIDPRAAATGYRDAAATLLVPAGPTEVRLLDPQPA